MRPPPSADTAVALLRGEVAELHNAQAQVQTQIQAQLQVQAQVQTQIQAQLQVHAQAAQNPIDVMALFQLFTAQRTPDPANAAAMNEQTLRLMEQMQSILKQ